MAFSSSLYDRKLTAGTRKRLFRTAESTVPHRRKSSSDTRKSLFRMAEKPLWRRWKKDFDYVGQYILLCVSRICKTPKSRVFAAESMSVRKNGGIFALRCIFMHAPMYIYACFHVHLFMPPCIFIHTSIHICAYSCCGRHGMLRFFFRLATT